MAWRARRSWVNTAWTAATQIWVSRWVGYADRAASGPNTVGAGPRRVVVAAIKVGDEDPSEVLAQQAVRHDARAAGMPLDVAFAFRGHQQPGVAVGPRLPPAGLVSARQRWRRARRLAAAALRSRPRSRAAHADRPSTVGCCGWASAAPCADGRPAPSPARPAVPVPPPRRSRSSRAAFPATTGTRSTSPSAPDAPSPPRGPTAEGRSLAAAVRHAPRPTDRRSRDSAPADA